MYKSINQFTLLALSPDDRIAASTSKAQPNRCTGEVSEGQTADPVIYGSLQSNSLVFIVACVSFPPEEWWERK